MIASIVTNGFFTGGTIGYILTDGIGDFGGGGGGGGGSIITYYDLHRKTSKS